MSNNKPDTTQEYDIGSLHDRLEVLSEAIKDQFENYQYDEKLGIADIHHILYAGNIESPILVVQMHPDKTELAWAKKENTHKDYICFGDVGGKFRSHASDAGFDPEKDFLYVNIIPFYPLGGSGYSDEQIKQLIWIFDGIMYVIRPKVVITLGYEPFKIFYQDSIQKDVFNRLIRLKNPVEALRQEDDFVIIPLQDPKLIGSTGSRYQGFSTTLENFYTTKQMFLKERNIE